MTPPMTALVEREAVEAAVHAPIVRWSNGEQPKPLKAMVADAILALPRPGAEYRRGVEDAARSVEADPIAAGHVKKRIATAIRDSIAEKGGRDAR